MAFITVNIPYDIFNGAEISFKAPANCKDVDGLTVYYPDGEGGQFSRTFGFADGHGNRLTGYPLFGKDATVKVILDTSTNLAFVQNADTNAYLEGKMSNLPPTFLYDEFPSTTAEIVEKLKTATVFTINDGVTKLIAGADYRIICKAYGIDGIYTATKPATTTMIMAGNVLTNYLSFNYFNSAGKLQVNRYDGNGDSFPDFDLQIYRVVTVPMLDGVPTEGSDNLITSGTLYKALEDIKALIQS